MPTYNVPTLSGLVSASDSNLSSSIVMRDSNGDVAVGKTTGDEVRSTGGFGISPVTIAASRSLLLTESIILADATLGAVVLTLPAASTSTGHIYCVKKIDSSANTVTLDGYGSETIEGELNYVIPVQNDCAWFLCDGTTWYILS